MSKTMNQHDNVGTLVRLTIAKIQQRIARNWKTLYLCYIGIALLFAFIAVLFDTSDMTGHVEAVPQTLAKRWGGYKTGPQSEKCYRQERTAIILSIFFGTLGIDQWYAHHWPLAICKMLTAGGLGVWSIIDCVLWSVGGVYRTPGCGGNWSH